MPNSRKREPIRSYLDHLTYPKEMDRGFLKKYLTNIRLVLLLIITIALMGVVAYANLPKRLNPEIKIPIVTVVTVYPGAGPADVERQVTIPLEDSIRGVSGIETIQSGSRDNLSAITIQFFSGTDPDKAKDEVQSAVDTIGDLPQGSQRPNVKRLDFEDQPIWTLALTGRGSIPDLMRSSESLADRLEDAPKIDRVITTGLETQEIVVEMDPSQLAVYSLSANDLAAKVRAARSSYPAGTVRSAENSFTVAIDPAVETTAQVRDLPIDVNGSVVPLGDIATVMERSKIGQQEAYFASKDTEAIRTVQLYIYKTKDANITDAGADAKRIMDSFVAEKKGKFNVETVLNTSDEITKQFSDILLEFRSTILLVALVLLLFLGFRQALISVFTVPLTFLSSFVIMQYAGMSINFLSMFAFLLSLGLLVDDTIVVVSTITSYYRANKFTPSQAGLLTWRDTIIPIWSTTITTIWSFVPLLLASGIIGEFIKPIPIVVTATLLSSTAIAVLITLPLMVVLLKPNIAPRVKRLFKFMGIAGLLGIVFASAPLPIFGLIALVYIVFLIVAAITLPPIYRRTHGRFETIGWYRWTSGMFSKLNDRGLIDIEGLAGAYKRVILRVLPNKSSRRKVVAAIIIYSIFSFALLPLGFVKSEFFPKEDYNQMYIQIEYPSGTALSTTRQKAMALMPQMRRITELEYLTLEVGKVYSESDTTSGLTNGAFYTIRLTDPEDRSISSIDIAEQLRKQFAGYKEGTLQIIEVSGGPPAGADVQIALNGPDLNILGTQADRVVAYLKKRPTLTNVDKSVKPGASKLVFVPDQRKLAETGVTQDQIANSIRLFTSGSPLDQITLEQGADKKTDITLEMRRGYATPEELSQIRVSGSEGSEYPIYELGSFESRVSPTAISREDGQRTITISAAARPGANANQENADLIEYVHAMGLPAGYASKTGGVNEENQKSVFSILQAMLLSSILILITMVIQFQSFRKAVIVLMVIPLAVSSVFMAFALLGIPLSFPALIGVLSLFGIVVTNSMFIVDKINLNIREGMAFKEAIADAGASRMEPIILTKLTAVFGLLPITLGNALWQGLGGAIISGLLVASSIMLFFIPVVYYVWMQKE